jgi:AcrR family transcriptional regulator
VPTEARILEAAGAAFASSGFLGAKLADIAMSAGITRPSLLYHFDSKEALHTEVLRGVFADLRVALDQGMRTEGDFRVRVVGLMQSYLEFVDESKHFAPLVLRGFLDRHPVVQQVIGEQISPILELVEGWMEMEGEGVLPQDLDLRAALLQLCGDALLRAAAGPLRQPIWGDESSAGSLEMTRRLFTTLE